jgi:glyoxylase-like metal-dependent hydrolase (beta-lactamase superfamily II)
MEQNRKLAQGLRPVQELLRILSCITWGGNAMRNSIVVFLMKTSLLTLAIGLLCAAMTMPAWAQPPQGRGGRRGPGFGGPPVRTITQVSGDLYKVQSGAGIAAVTVFLVTPEGIILADPLNPEFAAWLKEELAKRFPGKPVKYVIESHYHWDHARGGGMFADTATFIGHENMRKNLAATLRQAPPPGDTMDRDGDNRLSREEAQTGTRANFDRFDGDHDGFLTPEEINADIRRPDIVFSDKYTVTLGGKHVELIWAKNRHSSDLIDMYFPEERVLFAGDYIWLKRMCCNFEFDRRPIATWIASIKALEQLDFDTVVNSHWDAGTKADLIEYRHWLEDLAAAVSAGMKEGKSLEELQKTIKLDKYKEWAGYDTQLPAIIQSAYNNLKKYPSN